MKNKKATNEKLLVRVYSRQKLKDRQDFARSRIINRLGDHNFRGSHKASFRAIYSRVFGIENLPGPGRANVFQNTMLKMIEDYPETKDTKFFRETILLFKETMLKARTQCKENPKVLDDTFKYVDQLEIAIGNVFDKNYGYFDLTNRYFFTYLFKSKMDELRQLVQHSVLINEAPRGTREEREKMSWNQIKKATAKRREGSHNRVRLERKHYGIYAGYRKMELLVTLPFYWAIFAFIYAHVIFGVIPLTFGWGLG